MEQKTEGIRIVRDAAEELRQWEGQNGVQAKAETRMGRERDRETSKGGRKPERGRERSRRKERRERCQGPGHGRAMLAPQSLPCLHPEPS